MMRFRCLALSTLALALAACQTQPSVGDDIDRALDESAQTPAKPLAPAPAAVNAALLPPVASAPRPVRHEPRFDLAVKEAQARDFFMGLVEGTPQNMLVHPGVTGTVTLSLKNVTVSEVMDAVRSVYGYDYSYRNGIYEVMPGGLATRFFPINYLNLKRLGESRVRVNSGQLSETSRDDAEGGGGDSTQVGGTSQSVQTPSTQIATDSQTDLWSELSTSLRAIVGEGKDRQVITSPQTGVVVVRALPNELRAVEDFLDRAQLNLQRQVILEAKILEVQLSDGFQSGINWQKLGSVNGNPFNLGITGPSIGGVLPGVGPVFPGLATSTNPLGGVLTGTFETGSFAGVVELLQTQGDVRVLSSPRVSTVNNQKAVIKVGQDEFFVTDISSSNTVTGGSTTIPTQDVTLTPFFSGIALDVTPQISDAGDITLHVHPSISEVTDQRKEIELTTGTLVLPLALSTIRESDSIVRAHSGQVVVIGGLMQNKSADGESGAPGLSDIPVLGHLFKQQKNKTNKSELVILLRPVVVDERTWDAQIKATRERFGRLEDPLDSTFKP